MVRKDRRWVPMDVDFPQDCIANNVTPSAAMLYMAVLGWKQTASRVATLCSPQFTHFAFYSARNRRCLERAGWLVDKGNGEWDIPAWGKWHESKEQVEARLRADRNRKRLANGISRSAFRLPD